MDITPNSGQPTGVGGGYEDVLSGSPSSAPPTISNAANAAVAASQQPGMTTPPPQPAAPPPPPKKNGLAEILHAVGNALGGGETEKFVNKQTGAIEERPRSTGSKIGSALSTIAMGAAAGAAQHGPGSIGRSALAGGQVVQDAQDRQNRQLQADSQNVRETNAANQQALLTQASLAKSNQEVARMMLDHKRAGLDFSKEQADVANEMASIKSIPGAKQIAHFNTNEELNSYLEQAGPEQSKQHAMDFARNLIRAVPSAGGGFDAYSVPKGWDQQTIGPGHTVSIMSTQLGKGGKPEPVWRTIDAPEDMTFGNYLQWQGQTLKSSMDSDLNQASLAEKKATTAKTLAEADPNFQVQQAGAKAAAVAKATQPYQVSLKQMEAPIAEGVASNKEAREAVQGAYVKPFLAKMDGARELVSSLAQAESGNAAASKAAIFKMAGMALPAEGKRGFTAAVDALEKQGNIPQQYIGSIKEALTGDKWTSKMSQDMKDFAQAQTEVAKQTLRSGVQATNALHGTKIDPEALIQAAGPLNIPAAGPQAGKWGSLIPTANTLKP